MKYAGMSRLALPLGFGFEEIIEYGEEMESWNSLSATLDRVQNYDRNAETVKQIDEIIKTAEGMKMGATSDEIDEINDLIQTAEDKKAEFDE